MKVTDIRKLAKSRGLTNYSRLKKGDLIRTIQQAEGNPTCYEDNPDTCGQMSCLWREDCNKAVHNSAR